SRRDRLGGEAYSPRKPREPPKYVALNVHGKTPSNLAGQMAPNPGSEDNRPIGRMRLPTPLLLATRLKACSGPRAVRGGPGTDRPDLDRAAMSTGLDRDDLDYLFKENIDRLLASRAWASFRMAPSRPVVAIWPIRNDTTEHIDNQLNTLL